MPAGKPLHGKTGDGLQSIIVGEKPVILFPPALVALIPTLLPEEKEERDGDGILYSERISESCSSKYSTASII